MASRHRRQLQHRVFSLTDVLSAAATAAAAIETRATDRRAIHGADAAASWLRPAGNRRSSTDRLACVRPVPGDIDSRLGNRRFWKHNAAMLLRQRYYAALALPMENRIVYSCVLYSVRLSVLPAQKVTCIRFKILLEKITG